MGQRSQPDALDSTLPLSKSQRNLQPQAADCVKGPFEVLATACRGTRRFSPRRVAIRAAEYCSVDAAKAGQAAVNPLRSESTERRKSPLFHA